MAKRKKKKIKKRRKKRGVIINVLLSVWSMIAENGGILVLVGIMVGGVFFLKEYCCLNESFNVAHISISPTRFFTKKDILAVAKLRQGENIFSVNIAQAARRLEDLPRIKRACVTRKLPHTIAVDIVERYEVAQIKLPFRRRYYLIDAKGCVLTPVLKERRKGLIVIEANFSNKSSLRPGDFFNNTFIVNGLAFVEDFQSIKVVKDEKIRAISIDRANEITIELANGIKINVGNASEEIVKKLASLPQVFQGTPRNTIKYIDLRYKDIVVKKR